MRLGPRAGFTYKAARIEGGALPFLLGVLGGVAAVGITGLFLGPTLLAIGYALLRDWTHTEKPGPQTMD